MRYRSAFPALLAACCALFSSACVALLGGFDFDGKPIGEAGGSGGAGTTSTSSSTSAAGGNGGGSACQPDQEKACYEGPDGTEGVGTCKAGTQVCASDGLAWEACAGQVTPKQETCADPKDEDCDGHDCVEWAELFGDGAAQGVGDVAFDATGNIIASGTFFGSIMIDGSPVPESGSGDALIVKVDPNGKPLWARAFGDSGEQQAGAVAVDSTGSIILGGCTASAFDFGGIMISSGEFLAKVSADGKSVAWAKSLGPTSCAGGAPAVARIAVTPTNDVVVAGTLKGTIDFGAGPITDAGGGDAFVAQLRGADGAVSPGGWVHVFGDTQAQEATDLTIDPANGDVLVVGEFYGTISLGSPATTAMSQGNYDAFLLRIWGDMGTPLAVKTFGGSGYEFARGIASGVSGYAIVGTFDETIACGGADSLTAPANATATYLIKFGAGDTYEWCKSYAPTGPLGEPNAVGRDSQGDIVMSGFFSGSIDFGGGPLTAANMGYATYLVKLGPDGKDLWARSFDTAGPMALSRARVLPTGETIMAGFVGGPIDFGTGLLTPAGTDAFIAKFGL